MDEFDRLRYDERRPVQQTRQNARLIAFGMMLDYGTWTLLVLACLYVACVHHQR